MVLVDYWYLILIQWLSHAWNIYSVSIHRHASVRLKCFEDTHGTHSACIMDVLFDFIMLLCDSAYPSITSISMTDTDHREISFQMSVRCGHG